MNKTEKRAMRHMALFFMLFYRIRVYSEKKYVIIQMNK